MMGRGVDTWIACNVVIFVATVVSGTRGWGWHQATRRAVRRLTGVPREMARLNMMVTRLWLFLNLAVALLDVYMFLVAWTLGRAAPVPGYVINGTVAWTVIWVLACLGAWWIRLSLNRAVVRATGVGRRPPGSAPLPNRRGTPNGTEDQARGLPAFAAWGADPEGGIG